MQETIAYSKHTISGYGLLAFFLVLICPIAGFLVALIALINYSSRKPYLQAIAIGYFFGGLSYWINPKINIDLVRYLEDVVPYMNMSFSDFWRYATTSTILPGKHVLFYLAGITGDAHVLPFISTSIAYSIIYYVSFDYAYRLDLSNSQKSRLVLYLLAFVPFLNISSNVRNIVAFSIFLLAVYRDIVEGKKRNLITWLLYILPITIHIAAIMLVAMRLIIPVIKKDNVKLWKRVLFVVIVLGGLLTLLYVIEARPTSLPARYYRYVFGKADRISSGEFGAATTLAQFTSPSRLLLRIFYEIIAAFSAFVLLKSRQVKPLNNYEMFCLVTSLVCLACAPVMQAIYIRFAMLLVSFCFPLLIDRVQTNNGSNMRLLSFSVALYVAAGVIYNIYRLYLSASIIQVLLNGSFRPFFIMFSNY